MSDVVDPSSGAWDPAGPAVIVDPYSSGAQLAPAFLSRGVPVVAVRTANQPPSVYASSYRPEDFKLDLVAGADFAQLLAEVAMLRPRCVLAGCESGVELAERLAARVVPEVANVAELADARRHKGAMAEAIRKAGVPGIEQICTSEPAAVAAWITDRELTGRHLVIKPPKSASTDGVTLVPHGRGWASMFEAMLGTTNRLGLVNESLVVQEYVQGTEYVVDTFSYAGTHTVTDVCRYSKIRNGPLMAVYDTMEWLPSDHCVVPTLVSYARRVLDAVGVRYGAAHVEIMLTPAGPRLIEVAARAHGGGQPRFCLHATGDSQIERTVRYFTEGGPIDEMYALRSHTMVVFHLARHDSLVGDTTPLDDITQLPSYLAGYHHLKPGQRVSATKDLFASLDLGFAVLSSPDREQILNDYRRIREIESLVLRAGQPEFAALEGTTR